VLITNYIAVDGMGAALINAGLATFISSVLQLAELFGTTLAPFVEAFGWPFEVLAGLIHSSMVFQAGLPLKGIDLYRNSSSDGLIAIVLQPIFTFLEKNRLALDSCAGWVSHRAKSSESRTYKLSPGYSAFTRKQHRFLLLM